MSCIEPLADREEERGSRGRGVSWDDAVREERSSSGLQKSEVKVKPPVKKQPSVDDEKLREMINIRRGSAQIDQKPREMINRRSAELSSEVSSSTTPADQQQKPNNNSKMTDDPRARPFLKRGSSVVTQQALKTSERPPLSRGYSCQARTFPSITITRPNIGDEGHNQRFHIMEAVDEIHDNFKAKSTEEVTEEETEEDEFHEIIPPTG